MRNITSKQKEFLKNLVLDMKNQDNRATQNIGFMIREDIKVPSEFGSHVERYEESDGELCEECEKKYNDSIDLPNECENCDDECFIHYDIEQRLNTNGPGIFLTEKACEEHIRLNDYHYNNPQSYGISFWRNPEIIELINILFDLVGEEKPNFYDNI